MAHLKIKPVAGSQNRVIVKAFETETKTAGGIYIPDTAQEKSQKGTVLSVSETDGNGNKPVVKKDDVVLFGKYTGTELNVDGQEYLIMRESDIYAIL